MADIVNNNNNLYWVFTAYGLNRLANFGTDDYLQLHKVKIGNYNWYEDPNGYLGTTYSENAFKKYYVDNGATTLGAALDTGDIFIDRKSVNTEKNIVTLTVTISEEISGFDIREMGIYETVDGVENLFAVCTFQPIPKPSISTNHYVSIQFDCNLTSVALTGVYDAIVLDPNNNYATVDEVNSFQENLLFVESNLAEQISNNAHIIGLNRPQQLYDKMIADRENYSNSAITTAYANFLNATSLDKVKSFWVFKPTNDLTKSLSVADLGIYNTYLGSDIVSSSYNNDFEGIASWMDFSGKHWYKLKRDVDFDFVEEASSAYDADTGVTTYTYRDCPFTIFFMGSQNSNTHDCTILAKDNDYSEVPGYRLSVTYDRALKLRLYTNFENYIEFKTTPGTVPKAGEFYVASIKYNGNPEDPVFSATINAKPVQGARTVTGAYTGMNKVDLNMTSYIATSSGNVDYVDSKMCMISLIKDVLSDEYIRVTSYNLMALIGKNPCLVQ